MRLITSPLFWTVVLILSPFGALIGLLLGVPYAGYHLIRVVLRSLKEAIEVVISAVGAWATFGYDTAALVFKRPGRVYQGWF